MPHGPNCWRTRTASARTVCPGAEINQSRKAGQIFRWRVPDQNFRRLPFALFLELSPSKTPSQATARRMGLPQSVPYNHHGLRVRLRYYRAARPRSAATQGRTWTCTCSSSGTGRRMGRWRGRLSKSRGRRPCSPLQPWGMRFERPWPTRDGSVTM